MKKLILISLLLIPISVYASWNSFMDKCIQSWIGYPIDDVINQWGYPHHDKNIAGRQLYVWETYDSMANRGRRGGGLTIISVDKKGRETIFMDDDETEYCIKTLEVDKNNIVVNGQWEGNACPLFYTLGKKLVNPKNDQWAVNKANKIK